MNRYNYQSNIQYQKYCIKELLKIKKENILQKIEYELNILQDLFNFKEDIKEYMNINIRLSDYMPEFYYTRIYEYLNHKNNRFLDMNLNTLNNALFYIKTAIHAINAAINDLYYTLI